LGSWGNKDYSTWRSKILMKEEETVNAVGSSQQQAGVSGGMKGNRTLALRKGGEMKIVKGVVGRSKSEL